MIVVAIVVHMLDLVPRGQALAVRELVLELVRIKVSGTRGEVLGAPVRVWGWVRGRAEGGHRLERLGVAVRGACTHEGGAEGVSGELFSGARDVFRGVGRAGSGRVEAG